MKNLFYLIILFFLYSNANAYQAAIVVFCDICPKERPFQQTFSGECHSNAVCFSCDATFAWQTTKEVCDMCSERKMMESNKFGTCILAQCPDDKPDRGEYGDCYNRFEKNCFYSTKEECDKVKNYGMFNNICIQKECSEGDFLGFDGIDENGYGFYFENLSDINDACTHANCYSCQANVALETSEKYCSMCSSRKMYKGFCIPKDNKEIEKMLDAM